MSEVVINDYNWTDHISPVIDGDRKSHGLIPRNFSTHPVGYLECAKPFDLPLIPESEWQSRLDAQKAAKAQLSDVRNRGMNGQPIPSRDQNGKGYCWAHSSVSAALIVRAVNNQPYVDLSAFAVACIIKGYQDEGGWGSESLEWIAANGVPSSQYWPQQSMSRSNDTPEMRANARQHEFSQWMDLDPNNMKAQLVTCLLLGIPVVSDMNWWGHSICTIDLVSINPFQTRIWNSWGDSWSENGTGILEGRKAIPDSALGARVMSAAIV
jgi:C1A family cysteine protease